MSEKVEFFQHERAIVEPQAKVGAGSRIWAFANIKAGSQRSGGDTLCARLLQHGCQCLQYLNAALTGLWTLADGDGRMVLSWLSLEKCFSVRHGVHQSVNLILS